MPTSRPLLFVCLLSLMTAAPAHAQSTDVKLDQFDGRWFEIVRNPNTVQKDCSRAQIDFLPQGSASGRAREADSRFAITVTCTRRADGQVEILRANARVTDLATRAKFRFSLTGLLSFGGLAGQNYWVWDHAPDYSWAIMGLPDKSNWWIWHRSQNPPEAVRAALLARARALGFDTSAPVHTGR